MIDMVRVSVRRRLFTIFGRSLRYQCFVIVVVVNSGKAVPLCIQRKEKPSGGLFASWLAG